MTEAEKQLWRRLRSERLEGFKFRRQHPLGRYVLDFFCEKAKLVIEIDGSQHADMVDVDLVRTRWLESRGCRVLRFWNNDVLQKTDAVLEAILAALSAAPHPARLRRATLSPKERVSGGGGAP